MRHFTHTGLGALALSAALCGSAAAQTPVPEPLPIGSITGRITDAPTGEPLGSELQATVELQRCVGRLCELLAFVAADEQGIFRIESSAPLPIPAGTFRLIASALGHARASVIVDVAAGEDVDAGDIALPRTPIEILNVQPCAVPAEGGTCAYSARIRNNTETRLTGTAFSGVDVGDPFPLPYLTRFEAGTRRGERTVRREPLALAPGGSRLVEFVFDVPAFVADGTQICTSLFVGLDPSPLLNVRLPVTLFCLQKGSTGFEAVRGGRRSAPITDGDATLRALDAPLVAFENLQPCATVPLTGGTCEYSLDIVSQAPDAILALAHSTVEGTFGSFRRVTFFEASGRRGGPDVTRPFLRLPAGGRATVTFSFDLPAVVPEGAYLPVCTRLSVGVQPSALFNPVREEPLFCLIRTDAGFQAVLGGTPVIIGVGAPVGGDQPAALPPPRTAPVLTSPGEPVHLFELPPPPIEPLRER